MSHATSLARWVRAALPREHPPLTHLKLQKLSFYCYGAALAFDCEDEVGADIVFQAWDHGPVNVDIWRQFRGHGASPIDPLPAEEAPTYPRPVTSHLQDVLTVYGGLDAWSLRQESHLEAPWIEAHRTGGGLIPTEAMRAHFRRKFNGKSVCYPEYLSMASSFALDGIPVTGHSSLRELAETVAGFSSRLARAQRG